MLKTPYERVGCLPYWFDSNGRLKLLFMKPSDPEYGGPDFQLCKGRLDMEGESREEVASREAREEVGLTIENTLYSYFLFTDIAYHRSGRRTKIHLFAARVKDPKELIPFGYETGEIAWFGIEEALVTVRHCHKPLVYAAIEIILKEELNDET